MQYYKCIECKNRGHMCQMLLAPGVCTVDNLETTLNRALSYSRQKDKDVKVKIAFECLGFEPLKEEATYNAE